MYLTNKFKTNVKKQVNEAKEEGKAEGKAEGREEIQKAWVAWNARRIEAESKGLPFNEPPPEPPENVQDTEE